MDETTAPSEGEVTSTGSVPTLELGEGVEEIAEVSVDLEWFAAFMRQRGVSDEEIQATTFLVMTDFLEQEPSDQTAVDDPIIGGGYYESSTKTVAVDIAARQWVVIKDPTNADEPGYPF